MRRVRVTCTPDHLLDKFSNTPPRPAYPLWGCEHKGVSEFIRILINYSSFPVHSVVDIMKGLWLCPVLPSGNAAARTLLLWTWPARGWPKAPCSQRFRSNLADASAPPSFFRKVYFCCQTRYYGDHSPCRGAPSSGLPGCTYCSRGAARSSLWVWTVCWIRHCKILFPVFPGSRWQIQWTKKYPAMKHSRCPKLLHSVVSSRIFFYYLTP